MIRPGTETPFFPEGGVDGDRPEIGSERYMAERADRKQAMEERDRPKRDEQDYDPNRWNLH